MAKAARAMTVVTTVAVVRAMKVVARVMILLLQFVKFGFSVGGVPVLKINIREH